MISDYEEEMDAVYIGIKKGETLCVSYVHTPYNKAKYISIKESGRRRYH
jgi:hypothetical protein